MTALRPEDVDEAFVPLPAPGVETISFDDDGEALLVDEAGTKLFRLNATGALVWSCFDGAGTVADIVGDLAEVLGAQPGVVRADVLELVRDLGSRRLLQGVLPSDGDDDATGAKDDPTDPYTNPRFIGEPPSH